ncbi:hypothetical protein MYAM1_000584 [Malassezia yamatoensis]|uniref:Uncharacterized protein n=1 Tax=Malassezia yamatoensis TaxID=253288 RepID=A0AAJ5YP00_9BASI|nr:hypothetical protein MYAM1_000584 [Malassezia yamatoensis]
MASEVHRALCPKILVLSGDDVDTVAGRNGARNFAELLRPFELSVSNISVRTSQLETRTHAEFSLRFDSQHILAENNSAAERGSLDYFLDSVQNHLRTHGQKTDYVHAIQSLEPSQDRSDWDKRVRETPPWSKEIASYLYRYRPLCAFDTFSRPTAMMLAVSGNHADPMNAFAQLYETSCSNSMLERINCSNTDILRMYLVVHDEANPNSDRSRSEALLDEVRKTYGLQCALLAINSAQETDATSLNLLRSEWNTPDLREAPMSEPEACLLSPTDRANIELFLREFVVKSLVPFLEKTLQHLNEQTGTARRGLTGRLLGAGRKWFSNKPQQEQVSLSGYDRQRNLYPTHSLVTQTRRLADLAFHLRDYHLAAEMYEVVRRDYEQDQATAYYAAATEMLCLTRSLSSNTDTHLFDFYTSACDNYLLGHTGRLYALRLTFLFSAIQTKRGCGGDVARAFLHAAEFTDEILRATVLESAALAFLCMPQPCVRKSAATLLESAEQFDSCGQKEFASRCYSLAGPYFERKAWPAIKDYVLLKLARHAQNSGQNEEALAYVVQLFYSSNRGESQDREVTKLLLEQYKYSDTKSSIELPTPIWKSALSQVMSPRTPAWDIFLEKHDYANLRHTGATSISIQDTLMLHLYAENPLHVPISVSGLKLAFREEGGEALGDATVSHDFATMVLGPRETRTVEISVKIMRCGLYRLAGLQFILEDGIAVEQSMLKPGPRLNATKAHRTSPHYAVDETLLVQINDNLPKLTIEMIHAPSEAFVGETLRLIMRISNKGAATARLFEILREPANCILGSDSKEIGLLNHTLPAQHVPSAKLFHEAEIAKDQSIELEWTLSLLTPLDTCVEWLFLYKCPQNHTLTSFAQHNISVKPLLVGNIAYKPAQQLSYLALMSLENQSDEVINIDGISLLSSQWRASTQAGSSQLGNHQSTNYAIAIERAVTPRDETIPMALAAIGPLLGQSWPAFEPAEITCHASRIHGQGAAMPLASYIASHGLLRAKSVEESYSFLPESVRQRAFLFVESNEVDFLVAWSLSNGRKGCTLLYGAQIGLRSDDPTELAKLSFITDTPSTSRALYAATVLEKAQLAQQLNVSPLANFGDCISVEVDVRSASHQPCPSDPPTIRAISVPLYIRNESVWRLEFTLRLLAAHNRSKPTQPIAPWTGNTIKRGTLEPWSILKIHALVLFNWVIGSAL